VEEGLFDKQQERFALFGTQLPVAQSGLNQLARGTVLVPEGGHGTFLVGCLIWDPPGRHLHEARGR
jgi:hypothetical protein